MTKPISPMIVTFKGYSSKKVRAIPEAEVGACHAVEQEYCCFYETDCPYGTCVDQHVIWREVPPKRDHE